MIQISREKIIPITLAVIISFFMIAIFSTTGMFYLYKDGNKRVSDLVSEQHYVDEKQKMYQILSGPARFNRLFKMYGEIHADHGKKYDSAFNKEGSWNKQGMKKEIRVQFFRRAIEYSWDLNIPDFDIITFYVKESAMNPKARTYKKVSVEAPGVFKNSDGDLVMLLEVSGFQLREVAVDHAVTVLFKCSPYMQERYAFKYNSLEDMFDPLNSLKVMALLIWDARRLFDNDPSWYIPAVHWGIKRIYKYYLAGVPLPEEFRFNKDTAKEYARDPLQYYNVWNAYNSQFSKLTTDVYIDQSWLKAYEKECSKMEWNFIYTHKYVKKMIFISDRMEKREKAYIAMTNKYENNQKKDYKLLQRKHEKVDDEYRKLIGLGKSGEKLWKIVFKDGFDLFKGIAAELRDEKIAKTKKAVILMSISLVVIIILLAIGMFIITIWYFQKKKKNREIK